MVKPDIRKASVLLRVGVCYTNKDGSYPTANFAIKRGYRSWGGNGVDPNDADLRKLFISLDLQYPDTQNPVTEGQQCFNLGAQNPQILNRTLDGSTLGCPATGLYARDNDRSDCSAFGGTPTFGRNHLPVCAFQPTTLTP